MISLLLAVALESGVNVSSTTGAMLATECGKSSETSLQFDPCVSYILGVADALQLDDKTCHGRSEAWSLQTVAIVRRYIRDHPENWGWSAVALVREPLMKAYPCPRNLDWEKPKKRG